MRILKHVNALGLTANQIEMVCKYFGYRTFEEPLIENASSKALEETTKSALSAVAQADGITKTGASQSAFSFNLAGLGLGKSPKR